MSTYSAFGEQVGQQFGHDRALPCSNCNVIYLFISFLYSFVYIRIDCIAATTAI